MELYQPGLHEKFRSCDRSWPCTPAACLRMLHHNVRYVLTRRVVDFSESDWIQNHFTRPSCSKSQYQDEVTELSCSLINSTYDNLITRFSIAEKSNAAVFVNGLLTD